MECWLKSAASECQHRREENYHGDQNTQMYRGVQLHVLGMVAAGLLRSAPSGNARFRAKFHGDWLLLYDGVP